LVDAVSYQTAGQLLDKHIIELLKKIASGKADEVSEVTEPETTTENETAGN
jgi:hypothetical protein